MDAPPPAGPCPWLVYQHGKGCKKQTFFCNITGLSPVKTYRKYIHALHHKTVLSCSHGRLVLYDHRTKLLSICNSTTFDDTIVLPTLHHLSNDRFTTSVLLPSSTGDRSNNFKVLIFFENLTSVMYCRVGTDGDEKWSELKYGVQLRALLDGEGQEAVRQYGRYGSFFVYQAVSCGGKIYALLCSERHYIYPCSMEIVEKQEGDRLVLSRLDMSGFYHQGFRSIDTYVLESCGEVFLLYLKISNLVFQVYKLNFETMIWEGVNSFKDRAFFVGQSYCLSCPVSGSGRIYSIDTYEQSSYCYYMHDDSCVVFLPHPDLPVSWRSPPIWITPQVLIKPEDDHCTQDNNINNHGRPILELDDNREEEELCNLPLDVLGQVSKHLVALDYMNFRAVNRICRSVCPPVNWRTRLSGTETNIPFPLLMFADRDESLYKFVDPRINSSDNCYLMRIPKHLEDHTFIRYSNQGWVLLSGKGGTVHLYNPFTGGMMSFANKPQFEQSLFFLSKPSGMSAQSFLVVGVELFRQNEVIVSTIKLGDEQWTHNEFQGGWIVKEGLDQSVGPVLFEDAFYFVDADRYLGKLKLDILEEDSYDMRWKVLDQVRGPCIGSSRQQFSLECGRELVSVFVGYMGNWVAVYKLHQNKRAWETVTTLGNYDLYVSPTSSFSVQTSLGGNRIYFPWFRGSGIVYFSLTTGKWHSSGSQDEWSDLYGIRFYLDACWIKPSWG